MSEAASAGMAEAAPSSVSETKPPSRRDALIRIGIVLGVLFVIFVIIMPRFVDYQDVLESLQGVTIQQFLFVSIFGLIAWILTGGVFAVLIPGLGWLRGLQSYLILTGIGASIPLGPWNMAVLWVVIRGWGLPAAATTGGILLYGIFDQLSRFGLMFVAGIFLVAAEALPRGVSVETGLIVGFLVVGGLLFAIVGGGLILVVRSEALARKIGKLAERIIGVALRRLDRTVPDIEGALVRFRVSLGDTVRAHGFAAFLVAMASKLAWALLMVVSMRAVGVTRERTPDRDHRGGGRLGLRHHRAADLTGWRRCPGTPLRVVLHDLHRWRRRGRDHGRDLPVPRLPVALPHPVVVDPAQPLSARQVAAPDQGGVPGRRAQPIPAPIPSA